MKKLLVLVVVLFAAGAAWAEDVPQEINGIVPFGPTGLWRFQEPLMDVVNPEDPADQGSATMAATLGVNMVNSSPPADPSDLEHNGHWFSGPWTIIAAAGDPNTLRFTDGGVSQERSWDFLTVNPSFVANGGGEYVNQYAVAFDFAQTSNGQFWDPAVDPNADGKYYSSMFQTADTGNGNDGDLFVKHEPPDQGGRAVSTIGVGDTGYSTMTFDSSTWHRYVLSVNNGDATGAGGFFRVYIDGTLYLDAPGQGLDGRMAPYTDHFHLFADNSWEDAWGMVGTVATWNRALTTNEIEQMGGWLNGSGVPTSLVIAAPGDANKDGLVNELDAQSLAMHWGATELPGPQPPFGYIDPNYDSWWEIGDFNFDHVVNAADASILAANWTGGGTGEAGAVPEPATAVMLVAALGVLACLRRRRQA